MNNTLRTKLSRCALLAGGAMILVGATVFASLSTVGRLRHDRAILEWNTRFGSLEDLLARHPNRDANPAALQIEALSARLGIDLAPDSLAGRSRPTDDQAHAHRSVKSALGRYLRGQIERPSRSVEPLPTVVATFLNDHDDLLRELRNALLVGDAPRWELRLQLGPENPVPNLLGHIMLQKVLLVEALGRAREGDDADAAAWAEASWRLNEALEGDPVLITQMIAMSIANLQAGTLRQLEHLPPEWPDRVRALSFRPSVRNALHGEIRYWTVGSTSIIDQGAGPWRSAVIAVATPYLRLCLADIGEESVRQMEHLEQSDYLCRRGSGPSEQQVGFARWNVLAPLILPNFASVMDRVARLELDLELTARILEMNALSDSGQPWPEVLASERSVACPGDEWIYDRSPDGEVSIRFSREIGWPENSSAFLPSSYTRGTLKPAPDGGHPGD